MVAGLTAAMNLFNPFGQAAATVTDLVKGDKVVAVEPRRDHRPGAEDDRLAGPDPLLYVLGALETNTLRRWARNREIDPVGLSRPELMVRILREIHVTSPKTLSDVLATLDDDELRDWGRIVGYAADDLPRSELAAMIEKAPLGPLPPGMTLS